MAESREVHWRDVDKGGGDKSKIHALRWDVYTKYREELINRKFLVSVTHPKRGNIVCTCVKDNVTEENEDCEAIGLGVFDYKLFEDEEGGGGGVESY